MMLRVIIIILDQYVDHDFCEHYCQVVSYSLDWRVGDFVATTNVSLLVVLVYPLTA